MREPDSNRKYRGQSPACYRYTIPLCNTLRSCSGSRSSRQRAIDVLQYQIGQRPLDSKQLGLNGTQSLSRNSIVLGKVSQISSLTLYKLLQLFKLTLFFRQQHIAIVYQALKFLGEVIPNLLVYYSDQLVRETN